MRWLTGVEIAFLLRALCVATILVAAVVMFGWSFHVPLATTVFPGLTTMKANTAVALAASAIAPLAPPRARATSALALLVVAIGLATLAEYALGLTLGLDEVLVADPATTSMPFPGRMSPASALSFVAIGSGLPLLSRGKHRSSLVTAHALALVPGLVSYLSLVGYIYGVERLYNFGPYVSVALNTASALGMLAVAMLLTRDREGWFRGFVAYPIATKVLLGLIAIALARELRRRFPDLPVVLASGYSHVLAQDADHGFRLLHKPYSAAQLSRVLRHAIAQRQAGVLMSG